MKHTERQHNSPSVSKRVYCSQRRHPNQHSVTVSKLVAMKTGKICNWNTGNWRKYDTNKRAYREVLRYRFHISNYTKHNKGTGLFGGRLSHAIHRLYAYLHPLVYNYVLQLPVLQSRPLQAYLQKDHRKCWWYPVFIKVLWNEIWQELQNVILWHKSLHNCPNAHSGKDRRRWSTFH
jgi:hypothetical protein